MLTHRIYLLNWQEPAPAIQLSKSDSWTITVASLLYDTNNYRDELTVQEFGYKDVYTEVMILGQNRRETLVT